MPEHIEREVKFVAGEGFKLPPLGPELPARAFVSTYHDASDLRLARHGVTLRHRLEDGKGVWQLKLPHGASRIELEEAGPPARPPKVHLDLLAAHLRGAKLLRVARLRTRRQGVRTRGAEVVDDSVAVLDGRRVTARFREVEVELLDGDEETLRLLESDLRQAGAEPAAFTPKLHRALDLAYPPETAEITGEETTPAGALRTALAEQYAQLLAHDPGTRLGTDSEDLHQMRVATRRARAYLRAARPLLHQTWLSELRGELGWLGSALGPARDLDVLLEHVRAESARLGSKGRLLEPLVDHLERERHEARGLVLEALSHPRYFALLDLLESVEPRLTPEAPATLVELWWAEFQRTRRSFDRLGPSSSDEELHAARIRVKRARYSAELAGHDLGRPGKRFVEAAKRLQDILGEHQDASVAEARIVAWLEDDPVADTGARLLLERERRRRKRARRDWPRAWDRLRRRARRARP